MKITHRVTTKVLYEDEQTTIRATVEAAVQNGAYLSGADLSGAYLSGAYLSGADLSSAKIGESDLPRLLAAIGIVVIKAKP